MADHTVQTDQASIAVLPASVRHRAGRRDRGPAGGRRAGRFSARCVTGIAAAVIAIPWSPLHAQSGGHGGAGWDPPEWVGDAAFLGLNALSSGISAGTIQLLRGGSFTDGFTRGALGGTVHYAGLRLTAQRFDGAGLLGRQLSAAGVSMTRNAADGVGTLERLFLPLGPVHLYVDLAEGIDVRPKVNVTALAMLVTSAAQPELEFDFGASLSAGAPVFRAPGRNVISGGREVNGFAGWGTIVLSDLDPNGFHEQVLAHERVHVAQHDWLFHVWSDPAEEWLMGRLPGGAALLRYVDIDLVAVGVQTAFYGLLGVKDGDQLHELEAQFLEAR